MSNLLATVITVEEWDEFTKTNGTDFHISDEYKEKLKVGDVLVILGSDGGETTLEEFSAENPPVGWTALQITDMAEDSIGFETFDIDDLEQFI